MPVTKTAKRALRSSNVKLGVNNTIRKNLEVAIRMAKKSLSIKDVQKVISLADRAAKKRVIHKNKASRIKSSISKLAKPSTKATAKPKKAKTPTKTSSKKN